MKQKKSYFWMLAYTFFVIAITTNIPSPLYTVYRHLWGISPGMLTLIHAVYTVFLIPSLLFFGQLSDLIGRKKVLITGILLVTVGSIVILLAQGLPSLFLAQIIQGIAAGMLNGVTTAALVELHPLQDHKAASFIATVSMAVGTAIDPLIGGFLVEYAPYPTALPYVTYLILIIPAIAAVITMPETVTLRTSESWRIQRPSVPAPIRKQFAIASATSFLCWAIMALFMTLVPAYVNTLLHVQNLVLAGGVTFVIFAASSVTQLAFNGIDSKKSMSLGLILLVVGLGIFLVSVNLQFLSMLFIGILVVGVGQALSFLGSMAIVNQAAPPERRGDIVSGLYVWSYSGVGFPIIGVGFAAEHFGLYETLIAFSGLVGAISLFLAFFIIRNRNRLVVSKRC